MINVSAFSFPINLIVAISISIIGMFLYRCKFVTSHYNKIISFLLLVISAIIIGFSPLSFIHIFTKLWLFGAIVVWFMITLLASLTKRLICDIKANSVSHSTIIFFLFHFGFYIILCSSYFGAADIEKATIKLHKNAIDNIAISEDNSVIMLPFDITLTDFSINYWPSGDVSHYEASILVTEPNNSTQNIILSVNHPKKQHGYDIYLQNIDTNSNLCTLQFVKQPWSVATTIGILLFLMGCLFFIFHKNKKMAIVTISTIVATIFIVSIITSHNEQPPILQSHWFIPHVVVYAFSYLTLSFAFLYSIISLFRENRTQKHYDFIYNMVSWGTILYSIGLFFGALWAKKAWGDFWMWDTKETWALICFLLYNLFLHIFQKHYAKSYYWIAVLFVAYIACQMCWWGINFLPYSESLHLY